MEITAAIVLFLVLTILVVAYRRKKVDPTTLQDLANLVTVSSVISAIVVGAIMGIGYLINTTPPIKPKPTVTLIPISTTTSTPDPCGIFISRVSRGSKVQSANLLSKNLNVRRLPSISADIITSVPNGTEFQILNGPICADGLMWWEASTMTGNTRGWIAEVNSNGIYYIEPK